MNNFVTVRYRCLNEYRDGSGNGSGGLVWERFDETLFDSEPHAGRGPARFHGVGSGLGAGQFIDSEQRLRIRRGRRRA